MAKASWIGQTIGGRYQIEQLLGQGGMSSVYRAQDPNLRRIVAIKLIHTHLSDDPSFVRRFMEEAATVAQLRHPNIIQVYDFDHDEDVYYIVFEFIPGESLHARLDRIVQSGRKLSFEEAIRITAAVADALDYAHRRNLVHRDVKPANVMINIQEEPILMDFGIVKIVGGTQHTATGATIGTARYMAPEQVRSENIDARTDIYSLGVVLYEMLAGRPPFVADSAMTMMMMHISDPVPDLSGFRPDTPRALREIVAKALAKNPAQRFQSAGELAAALRAVDLANPNQTLGLGLTAAAAAAATVVEPLPGTYERPAPAGGPRPIPAGAQPVRTSGSTAAGMGGPQPGVAQPVARPATAPPPERSSRTPLYLIGGGVALVFLLMVCVFGAMALYPALIGGGEDGPNATSAAIAAAETVVAGTATALSGELSTAEVIAEATLAAGGDPAAAAAATSIAATATEASQLATQAAQVLATQEAGANATAPATATSAAATEPPATQAPTATTPPTIAPSPTEAPTLAPTNTPEPTIEPTPEGVSVRITGITLVGGVYNVFFETFGYTPQLPGMHVHFFFNTVPPEQAGVPGGGPWILYGGSSPFTQYTEGDRPGAATQMCALVANSDHSVKQGSGNCWALP